MIISIVTSAVIVGYTLYTISSETTARLLSDKLLLKVPIVLYGIFRYLYLLYRRRLGGNPSELLLSDRALLINTICWICAVLLIIYGVRLE